MSALLSDSRFSIDSACLVLEELGYQAQLRIDDATGCPVIHSGMNGISFLVFFVGANNTDEWQMFGFRTDPEPSVKIRASNELNKKMVSSVSYFGPDGTAIRLQVPLNRDETTKAIFMRYIACWIIDMKHFARATEI